MKPVTPASSIRLLIVDDHAVVRDGLVAMLSAAPGIDRILTAADGAEALQLCASYDPHVVLLDLRMPGMDGHSVLEAISRQWPHIRVVILTGNDTASDVKLARSHGASGFLGKSVDPADILHVIHTVAGGGTYFCAAGQADECGLSPREFEIVQQLARGLTNDEIGRTLGITGQTVKGHLKHIFPKLQAASRAEAVGRAHELGLI